MRNQKLVEAQKLQKVRKWLAENKTRVLQSLLCAGAGILLYVAAEIGDSVGTSVENGYLLRNPCGKGEAVYEVYVEELDSSVTVFVPEQRMTAEEFSSRIPEMTELLCERILLENVSLEEVRSDLDLVQELEEYGVSVSWESERPDVVSTMGLVDVSEVEIAEDRGVDVSAEGDPGAGEKEEGILVYLQATLRHGDLSEVVEIPVMVYAPVIPVRERFFHAIEELVTLNPEQEKVELPAEFEGQRLTYRAPKESRNLALPLLGLVAAGCILLKDHSDRENALKLREERLMDDYPDLVSEILILTGAGYSVKAAWKKLSADYAASKKPDLHPLYEEMRTAVNQMETGMPETRVYAEFGKRCRLRCYVKFASLLESSVLTGGKNMRKLLENEVEEAFRQRTDIAARRGEELSSKLLLPMFGMLGVVMVMVVAPAFLSFG